MLQPPSCPIDGLSPSPRSHVGCCLPLLGSSAAFPRASRGRAHCTARQRVWVAGEGGRNCPDLSALGVAPCPRWTRFSCRGSVAGLSTCLPVAQQGRGSLGRMLSTTMVGALVRGWRNRSSPQRAQPKRVPQSPDGMRSQGTFLCTDFLFRV